MVRSTIQCFGRILNVLAVSNLLMILRFSWLKRGLELRPPIPSIGIEFEKKGIETKRHRNDENATIAILNVGCVRHS